MRLNPNGQKTVEISHSPIFQIDNQYSTPYLENKKVLINKKIEPLS